MLFFLVIRYLAFPCFFDAHLTFPNSLYHAFSMGWFLSYMISCISTLFLCFYIIRKHENSMEKQGIHGFHAFFQTFSTRGQLEVSLTILKNNQRHFLLVDWLYIFEEDNFLDTFIQYLLNAKLPFNMIMVNIVPYMAQTRSFSDCTKRKPSRISINFP